MAFRIETYKIIDVTTTADYTALNASQKAVYALLISAGVLNLAEGSSALDKLLTMFPEGTDTGDALRDPDGDFTLDPAQPNPE